MATQCPVWAVTRNTERDETKHDLPEWSLHTRFPFSPTSSLSPCHLYFTPPVPQWNPHCKQSPTNSTPSLTSLSGTAIGTLTSTSRKDGGSGVESESVIKLRESGLAGREGFSPCQEGASCCRCARAPALAHSLGWPLSWRKWLLGTQGLDWAEFKAVSK